MSSSDKVKVAVYSGSLEANVAGFIHEIRERMSDYVEDVKFVQLPYNVEDMKKMLKKMLKKKPEKKYYMLLCHSINNRRFSITNVPDALYDDFLRKAKKTLHRRKVGVIVHDFELTELEAEILENKMDFFKTTQERTFRKSMLQLLGGQLSESPVELKDFQWQELEKFLQNKLNTLIPPKPKKAKSQSMTPCGCGRGTSTEP